MRVTDDSGAVLSCPVCGQPMQLWSSGKLDIVEVDPS